MSAKKKPRVIIHSYDDGTFVLCNHKDVDVHWLEGRPPEYISGGAYNSNASDEELDDFLRRLLEDVIQN